MRPTALAVLLAPLAACVALPPVPPLGSPSVCAGLHGDPGITARLYFGRTRTDTAAWQKFLAENVTPRFPAGFSVFDGHGQWQQRSTGRIIQEPSTVIEVAAPRDPDTIWKFEEIRADYRAKFNQESVGLVISESCVSF
jgi:hypothetical protein